MKPRHGFTHPLWLGALGLLLLNDHALKGAGLLPGWATGKLSDFAGMIVAPLILAVAVRVSSERGWLLAHAAVGVVFAAIKLVPEAARAFEALTALTPFPWVIVVDPTDLIALPALFVSYRLLGRARADRGRYLEAALAAAGAIACMATSPPPCDGDDCQPPPLPLPDAPEEQAALVLANGTSEQRLVRVRALDTGLVVDCTAMLADPSGMLSDAHFAPAQSWLLDAGRALPLRNQGPCSAYLVDAQGLDPVLIAWNEMTFPTRPIVTNAAASPTTLLMRAVEDRLAIDPHPALFAGPSQEPLAPQPGCETPADTMGIDWSPPPLGIHEIVAISSSPDGCHLLELASDNFVVCLPLSSLPFAAGETIDVQPYSAESASEGIVLTGQTATIWAVRGDAIAQAYVGDGFSPSSEVRTGCGFHHDECANVVQPLDVTLLGAGVDGGASGGAGDALALNNGTLYLVRAQAMPIYDTECLPYATHHNYFESVLVLENAGE